MKKNLSFVMAFILIISLICSFTACNNIQEVKKDENLFKINIENTEKGIIKVENTKAHEGEEVLLNVTPQSNWCLVELKYNDKIINNYKFIMPNKDVTITSVWKEKPKDLAEYQVHSKDEDNYCLEKIINNNIDNVNIPKNITEIDSSAFDECKNIKFFNVDKENSNFKTIDGNLISKDETIFVKFAPAKKDTSIIIPSKTKKINAKAFKNNKTLDEIILPKVCSKIGEQAFKNCAALKTVKFTGIETIVNKVNYATADGDDVTVIPTFIIEQSAFEGCTNLEEIQLPKILKKIGKNAFKNCNKIAVVMFDGSSKQWQGIIIEKGNDIITNFDITFNKNDVYYIIVKNIENGKINVDKTSANKGDTITVNTTPNKGYELKEIQVNGKAIKGNSFTMPAKDVEVNAIFKLKSFNVTIKNNENGKINVDKTSAKKGDTITVNTTPNKGYEIKEIQVNGKAIKGNTFTMPAEDVEVNVIFNLKSFNVTIKENENGKINIDKTSANKGDTITINVTPNKGYELKEIQVNGKAIEGTIFTMPAKDVEINVIFEENPYDLEACYNKNYNKLKEVNVFLQMLEDRGGIEFMSKEKFLKMIGEGIPKSAFEHVTNVLLGINFAAFETDNAKLAVNAMNKLDEEANFVQYKNSNIVYEPYTKSLLEALIYGVSEKIDNNGVKYYVVNNTNTLFSVAPVTGEYIVPNDIDNLGFGSLCCNNMSRLIIPNTVKNIEISAIFGGNIKTIIINEGIKILPRSSICLRNSINLFLPKSLEKIEKYSIDDCEACGDYIDNVFYAGSKEDWEKVDNQSLNMDRVTMHYNWDNSVEMYDISLETNYQISNNKLSKTIAKAGEEISFTIGEFSDEFILKEIRLNNEVLTEKTFTMPAEHVTLKIIFERKDGKHQIKCYYSNQGNISISEDYAAYNEMINYNDYPCCGYKLNGILINGVLHKENPFKMPNEDIIVIPQFERAGKYIVNEINHNQGPVELSAYGGDEGDVITINATPNDGYEFIGVKVNGVESLGNTFTMPAKDVSLVLLWKLKDGYYTLKVNSEQGYFYFTNSNKEEVTTAKKGSIVTLNYNCYDNEHRIKTIYVNGKIIKGYTIVVNENIEVEVEWEYVENAHKVCCNSYVENKITVDKSIAAPGETVTIKVDNSQYYKITYTSNDVDINKDGTFIMPDHDVNFEVQQDKVDNAYYICQNINGWEGINKFNLTKTIAFEDEDIAFTIELKPGFTIESIKVTGNGIDIDLTKINQNNYSFIMPNFEVSVQIKVIQLK